MASKTTDIQKATNNVYEPPSTFDIVKKFEPQGDLTLYRMSSATKFTCGSCNKEKKAKLVATYLNQWDDLRCNACYGELRTR